MSGTGGLTVIADKPGMSAMEGQLVGWMDATAARTAELPALDPAEAVTALATQYSTTLYRVAYSVARNASDAEDAVQETFVRVLKHRDKLGEIRDLRVWLIRITWNVVLDRKRRSKVRPETEDIADLEHKLPAELPGAEDSLISSQSCNRVLRLIDKLPQKERQALLLSAIEELSTAQIAAVLGATESSIRSRIFRARRELATLLAKEGITR
jgi:RNA polymerase sigma-70 factor (ECF subfamily)